MALRNIITLGLLLFSGVVFGQEYMYVNTDNLIIRSSPGKDYMVFAIVHAPSHINIVAFSDSYYAHKPYTDKYYAVEISYKDSASDNRYHIYGYAEKKYFVKDITQVTVKDIDTSLELDLTRPETIPFVGSPGDNPNSRNKYRFNYPEYKGGDNFTSTLKVKPAPSVKRQYYTGARGGCYYINSEGHKIYVDKSLCK